MPNQDGPKTLGELIAHLTDLYREAGDVEVSIEIDGNLFYPEPQLSTNAEGNTVVSL